MSLVALFFQMPLRNNQCVFLCGSEKHYVIENYLSIFTTFRQISWKYLSIDGKDQIHIRIIVCE